MRTCLDRRGVSAKRAGEEEERRRDLAQVCICPLFAHRLCNPSPMSTLTNRAPAAAVAMVAVLKAEEEGGIRARANAADSRREKACDGRTGSSLGLMRRWSRPM